MWAEIKTIAKAVVAGGVAFIGAVTTTAIGAGTANLGDISGVTWLAAVGTGLAAFAATYWVPNTPKEG